MIEVILKLLFSIFFVGSYVGSKSAFEAPVLKSVPTTKECKERELRAVLMIESFAMIKPPVNSLRL